MSPGFVILISIATLSLLLVGLSWYLDRVWRRAGRGIEIRHRTAYRILESGKIPAFWMKRFLKPAGLDTLRSKTRAKRHALTMLDSYIRYFDRAAPFETIQAKRVFMAGFSRVRAAWADTPEDRIGSLIERTD